MCAGSFQVFSVTHLVFPMWGVRRYDVFWELSLPLAREAPSFPRSVLSSGEPKSVKHCLEAFFAGEKLEARRPRDIALRSAACTMQSMTWKSSHCAPLAPFNSALYGDDADVSCKIETYASSWLLCLVSISVRAERLGALHNLTA